MRLELVSVFKHFDSIKAVDGLDLEIEEGEIYGLLGPNGAGKSTTIRMIMGVIKPDQGKITLDHRSIDRKLLDRVGYLPEEKSLYKKMKVGEMILFYARLKAMKKDQAEREINKWLAKLGLEDWKNRRCDELSKGMQQKIQLISAVVHHPRLIILDEPFTGLDPINVDAVKDIILDLKKEGATIVFSTHQMHQVEKLCNSICLINKGKPLLRGQLDEIKKDIGENTVLLQFEGDGSFIKEITAVESCSDFGNCMELRLKRNTDIQALLALAMTKVKISRFEIKAPSLHDIFVQKVGNDNG